MPYVGGGGGGGGAVGGRVGMSCQNSKGNVFLFFFGVLNSDATECRLMPMKGRRSFFYFQIDKERNDEREEKSRAEQHSRSLVSIQVNDL